MTCCVTIFIRHILMHFTNYNFINNYILYVYFMTYVSFLISFIYHSSGSVSPTLKVRRKKISEIKNVTGQK